LLKVSLAVQQNLNGIALTPELLFRLIPGLSREWNL